MRILSFESSCDETAAAIVEDGRTILANIVASQIEIHALYGGVVPEIASRAHTEAISRITYQALEAAHLTMADIDAIAVTAKPGLVGALLVGVSFAKALAYSYGKPLVPVHHILGHVAANYPVHPELEPPFLALVASGGHTSILRMDSYTQAHTIGRTRDDAAGEAFDKIARVMGMPYPGGAAMDKLANEGDPHAIAFPSAAIAGDNFDFSFSGLKTAALNEIHRLEQIGKSLSRADLAASFTRAVTDSICKKISMAITATGAPALVVAGGVSANSHLREALTKTCAAHGCKLYLPPLSLCGDNAVMIGAQGYYEYLAGHLADLTLNAEPTAEL